MKKIYLGGKYSHLFALVDDEDYEYLSGKNWHYCRGYARNHHHGLGWNMQQIMLKAPKGMVVDHINRNKLDNRRCNLRIITWSDNQKNRGPGTPFEDILEGE